MTGNRWKSLGRAVEIGLAVPASTVAGYLLGRLGDRWLGTAPALSYAGALLGVIAAFVNLFRLAAPGRNGEE